MEEFLLVTDNNTVRSSSNNNTEYKVSRDVGTFQKKGQSEHSRIIAENIRNYLAESNYNQTTLAAKVGISKSTMSDYLNLRAKPSHRILQKIANVFEVGKSDIDTTYKDGKIDISPEAELLATHLNKDFTADDIAKIIDFIDLIKQSKNN